MRNAALVMIAITVASLTGCSSGGGTPSHEDIEEARQRARENVTRLAEAWQKKNNFEVYRLDVRDDASIGPDCPRGDGWAEAALVDKTTTQTVRLLKCSTVSETIGCMTAATFETSGHKAEDGVCNRSLPDPLPPVG